MTQKEEMAQFDPASFEHIPVLLNECLDGLNIDPAGIYLDGTAGGAGHGIEKINGALLDLGVSSHQLDDAARGFSYRADAPLDMRMSQQGETAADLVNTASREELARILRDYGEEPYAWQITGHIVEARETAPIETTLQLADIVPVPCRRQSGARTRTRRGVPFRRCASQSTMSWTL